MARLTKLRARQTRAAEEYTADDFNLATDGEVERRVLQHSSSFHHNRNDNSIFTFNVDGDLTKIEITTQDGLSLLQETLFTYDANKNITQITKEVWDDSSQQYLKLQKDFNFDANGNITNIVNTKI